MNKETVLNDKVIKLIYKKAREYLTIRSKEDTSYLSNEMTKSRTLTIKNFLEYLEGKTL